MAQSFLELALMSDRHSQFDSPIWMLKRRLRDIEPAINLNHFLIRFDFVGMISASILYDDNSYITYARHIQWGTSGVTGCVARGHNKLALTIFPMQIYDRRTIEFNGMRHPFRDFARILIKCMMLKNNAFDWCRRTKDKSFAIQLSRLVLPRKIWVEALSPFRQPN